METSTAEGEGGAGRGRGRAAGTGDSPGPGMTGARARDLVAILPGAYYEAGAGRGARVEYVSPQIRDLTGISAEEWSVRPEGWWDHVDPPDRDRVHGEVEAAAGAGRPFRVEYRVRTDGGAALWVRNDGFPLPAGPARGGPPRVRGFLLDVTERRVLERQFLQAQKMESIGRLAAGIAHDFNNLLTVIVGYGQLLQARLGRDPAARDPIEEIVRASERAAGLTRQLLRIARRSSVEPAALDVNGALRDLDRLARRILGDGFDVELALARDLGTAWMDGGQFDQLVMNLVVNARDAMPRGGLLAIRTEASVLEGEGGLPGRPCVCVTIRDNGTGMDEATRARMFEPFFTTKGEGKGTGLGLSTVQEIVRQARGRIEVETAPGSGTAIRILLPRHGGAGEAPRPAAPEARRSPAAGRTILLVEDEPSIRGFVRGLLEGEGCTVVDAGTVSEATSVLRERGAAVEALLVDASLPDGDGGRFVKDALAGRPELRAVVMSGFSPGVLQELGRESAGFHFLQKPFRPAELREAMERLFPGRGAEGVVPRPGLEPG